jgi:hypothetical protein
MTNPLTTLLRRLAPAAIATGLALGCAPAADAAPGTFTVHACGTPETTTGPAFGWTPTGVSGPFSAAQVSTCATDGSMTVGPGAHTFNYATGDGAGLLYTAPGNQLITRLKLDLNAQASSRDGTGGEYGALAFISRLTGGTTGFMDWCKATNWCFGRSVGGGAIYREAVQEYTGLNDPWVKIDARCEDAGSCHTVAGEPVLVRVNRAEVDLTESPAAAPISSNVQGSITTDAVLSGTEGLSFTATDNTSGVYRAVVKVGSTELPVALDGTSTSCVDARPGLGSEYEFTDDTPCPTSGSFSADIDTTRLPEGDQTLNVYVEDAGGLRSKAYGPKTINVDNVVSPDDPACRNGIDDDGDGKIDAADGGCANGSDTSEAGNGSSTTNTSSTSTTSTSTTNTTVNNSSNTGGAAAGSLAGVYVGPPTNGTNASNSARIVVSGSSKRTVKYGKSTRHTITLRDESGRPIAGAQVSILERMTVPGSPWVAARAPLTTDSDGRLSWRIPAKFGRTIRYAYKANLNNTEFQATTDLVLSVLSKTSIKTNHSFFHNGQTLRFTGKLKSRPVPKGGVLIDLQARVGKRWQTFKTVRTKSSGSWKAAYRFHATRGLQTYTFRARVRKDSGFPYAASRSRTVKVKVKG